MSTTFIDYDRVADTVMYLSDSITLEFVVQLSSKDRNGNRGFLHSETVYNSDKFEDQMQGRSIRRKMTSFYFVITDKTAFDRSFLIRPQDAQMLKMSIERDIFPWFYGNKPIYKIIDKEMKIVGEFNPMYYGRNEYSYLVFHPIVYSYEDGTFKQGIRLYISSETVYVDMDLDKFMGLYYLIANTDMYTAACTLVAYAKTPPYDVNVWNRSTGLAGSSNASRNDATWNTDNSNSERKPNGFFNNLKKKEKGEEK